MANDLNKTRIDHLFPLISTLSAGAFTPLSAAVFV